MSIATRIETGSEDEKESTLVAFVAESALNHGPMPNSIRTIWRLGLELGLKSVDADRIIKKGESLAERVRGTAIEKAIQNGDASTAVALLARESDVSRTANCVQSHLPCVQKCPEDYFPHPSVLFVLSSVVAVPLFFINPAAGIISFGICLGLCYAGEGVFASRFLKRERDRWNSIIKDVPELVYPEPPDFSASPYTVRGMHYDQWLAEFKSWSHSYTNGFCGSRSVTGKRYVREDSKWHIFFDEWQHDVFIPTVKRMNAEMKTKSDARFKRLREEYIRRFRAIPHESNIPEHFHKIYEYASIPNCYARKYFRNRRNNHI